MLSSVIYQESTELSALNVVTKSLRFVANPYLTETGATDLYICGSLIFILFGVRMPSVSSGFLSPYIPRLGAKVNYI